MGCITCISSAAICVTPQAYRVCSSFGICSVVSLCSQTSEFFPDRWVSLRSSPSFRNSSFSPKIAATVSSSAPIVVCGDASPLETHDFPSFSPNPRDDDIGSENLSAKERRKLRNERREAAISSQEQPWREVVEDRLLEKKKKIRGWREDADIDRCLEKGVQWWMIQTTRRYESNVAEEITRRFPARFPGREFQVFVPTVPVMTKLKDGGVSQSRKKLYQGIVLLRCLLDRDVYVMVKTIPRAYEFFGNQAGLSIQPIVMPAPVSNYNMDVLFQKIQKQEEQYEEFKEQCRRELEEEKREKERKKKEQQQWDDEQKLLQSKGLVLEVGATVRILSGPFMDFTGVVIELLSKTKIKVLVAVFGNDTRIVLDIEDVVVEATAGNSKPRTKKTS